jgi:predicted metal-dependent HD superfamily phosphohydrolase
MLALPNFQVSTTVTPPSVASFPPFEQVPPPSQLYRHYKGALYQTRGGCTIETTLKQGVLYQAVDPLARQDVWMRPILDFSAVVHEAAGLLRFTPVPLATDEALNHYLPSSLIQPAIRDSALMRQEGPDRFFHTKQRVLSTFEFALSLNLVLTAEQALAILFKDIVYLPGVPDGTNEKLSALTLSSYAHSLPGLDTARACKLIEDTAHRTPTSEYSALVLDLDWVHLAANGLQFCVNEELIWLENRHLLDSANPRKDFDTRRLKFLLHNLEKTALFQSEFLLHVEETARANIEGLRQAWQQKYGQKK